MVRVTNHLPNTSHARCRPTSPVSYGPASVRIARKQLAKCARLATLGLLALSMHSAPVRAQTSAYCEQVEARAASDAALLMAPRLMLQELRFPKNQQIDLGSMTGNGYQFRGGLSFSPVEFFKGLETLDVGKAACREHEAFQSLHERLEHANDIARLSALQAQAKYLSEHKDEWQAIVSKAADRLSRQVITLLDFTNLHQLTDTLDRKLIQVEGGAADLQARTTTRATDSLDTLVEHYAEASARFEHATAQVRALDAWQFRLTGGLIAQSPADWYGLAELSVSLGGLFRLPSEATYARARETELRTAPYELPAQVRELRAQTSAALEQARRELQITERSVATVVSARQVLEKVDAENVAHARDALSLERFSVESDVVFLHELIDGLALASE
jgi:hypothetical protein